jgi:MarR family transcriptional regulator, lower aerobic nicotinate degradation pathway regulator
MTPGYAARVKQSQATAAEPAADASACGLLFVRLAHVSRARLAEALEGMGLRPADFAVLHHLAETGPTTQLMLARALRIHPSNLVALLDGLEAAGLLGRARDPADRRRHVVALTAAGAKLLVAAQEAAREAEQELLEPLEPAERAELEGLLRRVAAHSCVGPKKRGC